MIILNLPRLLLPATLLLIAACAQQPASVTLEEKQLDRCPLDLHVGQSFILTLPSDPTTGYRWVVADSAPAVLRSLGPEVFSTPENTELVGVAGQSTWRFQVEKAGSGRLLLNYQRPWETGSPPAKTVDCSLNAK